MEQRTESQPMSNHALRAVLCLGYIGLLCVTNVQGEESTMAVEQKHENCTVTPLVVPETSSGPLAMNARDGEFAMAERFRDAPQCITSPRLLAQGERITFQFYLPEGRVLLHGSPDGSDDRICVLMRDMSMKRVSEEDLREMLRPQSASTGR